MLEFYFQKDHKKEINREICQNCQPNNLALSKKDQVSLFLTSWLTIVVLYFRTFRTSLPHYVWHCAISYIFDAMFRYSWRNIETFKEHNFFPSKSWQTLLADHIHYTGYGSVTVTPLWLRSFANCLIKRQLIRHFWNYKSALSVIKVPYKCPMI